MRRRPKDQEHRHQELDDSDKVVNFLPEDVNSIIVVRIGFPLKGSIRATMGVTTRVL